MIVTGTAFKLQPSLGRQVTAEPLPEPIQCREAAHKRAAEIRELNFTRMGKQLISRETAIIIMVANGLIAEGFISVSSLGRWERRNLPAKTADLRMKIGLA